MNNISAEQDLAQREQALNINESFIIQAPAGSGKTELLIQRLLALFAHVNSPEEVIAITFTKKAANEMRERVIDALKDAACTPEPDSAHKRKTWRLAQNVLRRDKENNWQLLINPNQMQIKTIDSLCSYLTTQLPLLAQFGSQPEIADTPSALYEEAAHHVLLQIEGDAAWSDSIAALLMHLDNDLNQLKDLLISLLAKRDQWLSHIFSHTGEEAITDLLEDYILSIEQDALATAEEMMPVELYSEALEMLEYANNNLRDNQDHTDSSIWRSLSTLLLTKDFSWRKTVNVKNGFPATTGIKNAEEKRRITEYKERMMNLLAELASDEDLRLALEDIARLPQPGAQKVESGILEHLIPILKLTAAQLRLTFQLHGKIDFIENALAALTALGDSESPTNLALSLDYKIQHILIDEFQDTSSTQYNLLRKLTHGWQTGDGRTLFVVGDPMQSIYRFREAEVGLFLRMRTQGLGDIKLTPLTLALNFRSVPEIVDWNNQHFSAIFPQQTNSATGAVTYSASVTQQSSSQGEVEIAGFSPDDTTSQAEYVFEKITSWQQQYPNDDIAILVRSRSHLKSIISVIRERNIPYQAIEIDPLATRQPIQDLLSLTAALLHLGDRIAWLAILRAPWCGLTLADLLIITTCGKFDIIWEKLQQDTIRDQLSEQGKYALGRIMPALQRALALRGRRPLREWIETTWLLLGAPACLSNEADLADTQTFFATLAQLDNDVNSFSTDKLKEKISKAYAAADKNANLQIMTIHAAKGLEFDTVILPHLEKSLPSDDKSLLLWMEHTLKNRDTALLLAPVKATDEKRHSTYDYIRWQQKTKSQFETDRLFYVAATRAKKRLLLSYDRKRILKNDSFLKKLQPFIGAVTLDEKNSTININQKAPTQLLTRLSNQWQNSFVLNTPSATTKHNTFTGFMLGSDLPRKTGIIIHSLLQQIALQSINWWQQLSDIQRDHILSNLMRHHTIQQSDTKQCQSETLTAINNTITDQRGQWILHSHTDAKSEYAITYCDDDKYKNYVIDRTFVDDNGTRWIIDYKTSQPTEDMSLDEFLTREKEAYAEQMRHYADAIKSTGQDDIKLGLYFPMIQGWVEM